MIKKILVKENFKLFRYYSALKKKKKKRIMIFKKYLMKYLFSFYIKLFNKYQIFIQIEVHF